MHSFGRAERLDRAALERLVRSIRRVLDADGGVAAADATGVTGAIEIEASFELGVVHVVAELWARLGIGQAIQTGWRRTSGGHRTRPRCWRWRRSAWRGRAPSCQQQRLLDRVWLPAAEDAPAALSRARVWSSTAIHWPEVSGTAPIVPARCRPVFRATTAWFECDEEDVAPETSRGLTFEPLCKRGHIKEGRDNDPQVIVALAVTRDGMLVRSWVLPVTPPT